MIQDSSANDIYGTIIIKINCQSQEHCFFYQTKEDSLCNQSPIMIISLSMFSFKLIMIYKDLMKLKYKLRSIALEKDEEHAKDNCIYHKHYYCLSQGHF
jgi:hypothetical protein